MPGLVGVPVHVLLAASSSGTMEVSVGYRVVHSQTPQTTRDVIGRGSSDRPVITQDTEALQRRCIQCLQLAGTMFSLRSHNFEILQVCLHGV